MAKKEVAGYKVKDLAAEFEITPTECRKYLRTIKAEKPEEGWVWPKKTDSGLVQIRKDLKAYIKQLGEKAEKAAPEKKKAPAKKAPARKKKAE